MPGTLRRRQRHSGDVLSTWVGRAPVRRTSRRHGRDFTASAAATARARPARLVMKLFRVRARRRKTDNWLQHRKSGPTGAAPPTRAPVYYTHRRPGPAFRSFSVRSPIAAEAVKQRLRLKAVVVDVQRWRAPLRCGQAEPARSVSLTLAVAVLCFYSFN